MLDGNHWADIFLWRLRPSPRALRVWAWVLAAAPLAWAGGLALRYAMITHTWPQAVVDRAGALRKSAQEARRHGVDTTGWTESVQLRSDPLLDDAVPAS